MKSIYVKRVKRLPPDLQSHFSWLCTLEALKICGRLVSELPPSFCREDFESLFLICSTSLPGDAPPYLALMALNDRLSRAYMDTDEGRGRDVLRLMSMTLDIFMHQVHGHCDWHDSVVNLEACVLESGHGSQYHTPNFLFREFVSKISDDMPT